MISLMRNIVARYILFAVMALCVASCADSASMHDKEINDAEKLMLTDADSAMAILDDIDPSSLKVDSMCAKYHYLRAFGHMRQNRSMIADSLLSAVSPISPKI